MTHSLSRRDFLGATGATLSLGRLSVDPSFFAPPRPTPSPAQLAWQRDELALFLHFGVNTFTDREWGDGTEDPAIFNPTALDARSWVQSAKAAGFRALILTAKHHDGFCLWPTKTTRHSVASSPWKNGAGDVVREFTDACREQGVRAGLYCSPWDRNSPAYGDSPRYNELYVEQLTELLSNYGTLHEFWFDGANGEGPNGKKQVYEWKKYFDLVHRLQPNAVIFSDAGPDVRWIGNERGEAGDPNWSTMDPAAVPYPGADGDGIIGALQHGDPAGTVWRPGETDVSIRPGWFYHSAEDEKVRSAENLVGLYFTSVGRNSKLLLNVPPNRSGQLSQVDASRLLGMRKELGRMFEKDLAAGARMVRRRPSPTSAIAILNFPKPRRVGIVDLREEIEGGQVISRYRVEGNTGRSWKLLSQGTTIGNRKLDRFDPVSVKSVRVTVLDAVGVPRPLKIGLYEG